MRITLIQTNIIWENREENLKNFSSLLSGLCNKTDLVILPETFTTGFSMNSETLAEDFPDTTFDWMKEEARKGDFGICGSYIVRAEGNCYNRLLFFKPDGEHIFYDKRHLFGIGGEDKVFTSGKERVVVHFQGVRICLQVCYDLRFPVWSRNKNDYDFLIYVANWPERRHEVWTTLLKARAIENQCYVAGVNRIGTDGEGLSYIGDSMVVNPLGRVITSVNSHTEDIYTVEISLEELNDFRQKFPVWKDADEFKINL